MEESFADELSYRVVTEQQRLTAVYPISIAALSFLNSITSLPRNRFVSLEQLCINKERLFTDNIEVIKDYSTDYELFWPSNNDTINLKRRLLSLYSDVFETNSNNQLKLNMTGDNLVDAALVMKLMMYRNTCVHLFAKPAYILLACQTNSQVRKQRRNHHLFTNHPFIAKSVAY